MRRLVVIGVVVANVAVAAVLIGWLGPRPDRPVTAPAPAVPPTTADAGWAVLGPQARCDRAVSLVTQPDPWPTICRWREPADGLQGQAFPPPRGAPPYDNPHIEIYVDRSQSADDVARAIAHELGHMRHTREATFGPAWLAARGLPAETPSSVWTEDYAEVFAALFAPPSGKWRAPTPRPGGEALDRLKAQFFS